MIALLLAACTSAAPPPAADSSDPVVPVQATTSGSSSKGTPSPTPAPVNAAPAPATTLAQPPVVSVSLGDAIDALFPDGLPPDTCTEGDDALRIRCLVSRHYADDAAATALALEMFDRTGDVSGVERSQTMDGGFRGVLSLVPERPVGRHFKHLQWVAAARRDHAEFFDEIARRAERPIAYRHRALTLRWFRSVGRTTPSAYASGWSVAWNVSGSLHKNADKARETLFHEVFHLNDFDHGDWSRRALAQIHAGIFTRCGTSRRCLRPYAPSETTVRGGTYYAFQPDNGDSFHEYAAELALRWYRENRAVIRREPTGQEPFKCGPEENARAWRLLVAEFFAGVDLVPHCGPHSDR